MQTHSAHCLYVDPVELNQAVLRQSRSLAVGTRHPAGTYVLGLEVGRAGHTRLCWERLKINRITNYLFTIVLYEQNFKLIEKQKSLVSYRRRNGVRAHSAGACPRVAAATRRMNEYLNFEIEHLISYEISSSRAANWFILLKLVLTSTVSAGEHAQCACRP